MEIFLIRLLQFMFAISLLVLLHEGGHFFFARLFGVKVEKFYLFFDPWFHLFEFKPKNSDTRYGVGWLPLGGYCKIAGMVRVWIQNSCKSLPNLGSLEVNPLGNAF